MKPLTGIRRYRGHRYQICSDGKYYYASTDCGVGVGIYEDAFGYATWDDAINRVHRIIDSYIDEHSKMFGNEIKVGARLYSHEANEKCTVVAFNGSSMTVKFDSGNTQEFSSDYAFDVIYDFKAEEEEDGAQYDIVCEGHTSNGMKFQIITDSQHKDQGYGFAVDIWNCFEEDYTKYDFGYHTLQAVIDKIDMIESEYSKNKDKLELLKPGEYVIIQRQGSSESELIHVQSIGQEVVRYARPGHFGEWVCDISYIVPLSAEVIPWTAEELQKHVGCLFRCHKHISMAVGYSETGKTLELAKVSEIVSVSADDLINHGYEVKTDEGWKPCYNVKWKE